MLAEIGNFKFEINETAYEKLSRSINYKFNSTQRLGSFDNWQSVGKYEETINLEGTLILKSQEQLKDFETMAKEKKVQRFGTAKISKQVIILNLELDRSNFLNDGQFLKQSFKISMAVVGGVNNGK